MRLLRPFTGTGAVFFPEGPPPNGTCEFTTEACRKHCYVNDQSDFDEEVRIPTWVKREVYDHIINLPIRKVCRRLCRDLVGLQTPILHWFASGDCPSKDVGRISAIIESMPPDVVQMGFTRNIELWERHKDIFALTLERLGVAPDPHAMYSCPNYEKEVSVMWCPSYDVRGGFCGPILCRDASRTHPELTHYINCRTCHRLKTGCFDRRTDETTQSEA
jgi:hypothetical protein